MGDFTEANRASNARGHIIIRRPINATSTHSFEGFITTRLTDSRENVVSIGSIY